MSGSDKYSREGLEGRYANSFKVANNQSEFLLDFGQYYSEQDNVSFFLRIIMSPQHAKALLGLLQKSVRQYDEFHDDLSQEV